MKTEHRSTHQIKSLTFLLSQAEGVEIEELQGNRVRMRVPANNRLFDGEANNDAWFYVVAGIHIGNATTPAPVGLTLRDPGCHRLLGNDSDSPRKAIISEFVFDLDIAADAVAFENIPIIIKGFPVASDAPATFVLPEFTSTADPVLTVTDKDGGAVGLSYTITSMSAGDGGESGGDAATLQGHPASDFALTSHTHLSSAITDFNEAVQDAVAAALVAGSGQSITYDDASNTITFVNSAPLTAEGVQDIVGAMVAAGTNVSATYDDGAGTLTIAATGGGGGGLTQEEVEDVVAALLVAGSNVTLNYNDATGELEIVASGSTSDADTLEGFDGAYYRSADNHTDGTTNKVFTATEKTKLAGVATGATANIKASDAEVITGTENTKFVTPAQAKLAAETHATGGGGGGGGLTANRIKKLIFDQALGIMEYKLVIGAGTDPVIINGAINAASLKAALEASSDLAGFTVAVKGSTVGLGGGTPGVKEVQSYTFTNYMPMDGLAVGFNDSSYYDIGSATNYSTGAVSLASIQTGLNALTEFASNPVTVSGTLNYDVGMSEYNGTLILTWNNNAPVTSLVKLISPMMMYEMGSLTRNTAGAAKVGFGAAVHTGAFYVFLSGAGPYPAWESIKNSEVQLLEVVSGGVGNYTLNAGANFTLGETEDNLQVNQRALGGDYANVVVKGITYAAGADLARIGQIATSTTYSTFNAANLTDNDPDTWWWSAGGNQPADKRITASFGLPVLITSYKLAVNNDAGSYGAAFPTAWTLEGSNDGTTWNTVDTRTGQALTYAGNTFTITTPVAYRIYRLTVTNAAGTSSAILTQFSLYSSAATAYVLSFFAESIGDVAAPSATGTGATASTLYDYGSDSELVTVEDASLDELLWAAIP